MTATLDPRTRSRLASDIESLRPRDRARRDSLVADDRTVPGRVAGAVPQRGGARIRPLSASRFVRGWLTAITQAGGALAQVGEAITDPVPEVPDRSVRGFLAELTAET